MSVPRNKQPEFTYTLLSENIHELTLHTPTQTALNRCFEQLDAIFTSAPEGHPLLLLSDIRESGAPPLTALLQFTQRLRGSYPQHEVVYDAILHNLTGTMQVTFMKVVQQLAVLFGARVAFFRANEREKAIAWLLEKSSGWPVR